MTLTVYGEDLSDLTDSDFTLQLDCSGLGEEESQVTLTVLLSEKAEDQDITPKAPAVSVLSKRMKRAATPLRKSEKADAG